MIHLREIGPDDIDLLLAVPPGLFDADVRPDLSRDFLANPDKILLLAFDGDLAVGMLTATRLLHPDKAPALFVNEVGTRDSHLRQGIATALMQRVIDLARVRGCQGIWLGTEPDNEPALGLYRKLGGDEVAFTGFGWDDAL
jgi:ribosomal protein S18 acetylase RimI-like enzyme